MKYADLTVKLLLFSFQKQMEDEVISPDPANLSESELRPGEDVGMMNNGIKNMSMKLLLLLLYDL